MAAYTRLNVGGPADLLAQPKTRQELIQLLKAARQVSMPVTFVGGGCNLLVSDQGIRGLVVVTTKLKSGIRTAPIPEAGPCFRGSGRTAFHSLQLCGPP